MLVHGEILDLPQATKTMLERDGLPMTTVLNVSFEVEDGTLPSLDEYCRSNNLPQVDNGQMCYRIGTDEGCQICVMRGDGLVFAIDPTGNHKNRFMNTSVQMFLKLLAFYHDYATGVESLTEDQAPSLAEQTVVRMRETDPDAFSDPDCWWATVAQQMELGLL